MTRFLLSEQSGLNLPDVKLLLGLAVDVLLSFLY
jgi:hypothetical protein